VLLLALLVQVQAPAVPAVTIRPDTVLVERDGDSQYLNFDIVVRNGGADTVTLNAVRLEARDAAGRVVVRRFIDGSGFSPSIATVPGRVVAPGASAIVYNPFHTLPGRLRLAALRYDFEFSAGDTTVTATATVRPVEFRPATALALPLAGSILVFDGHDFYGHHRRWDLTHPVMKLIGVTRNAGRYAYDLAHADREGRMFRTDGKRNADWLAWEAPVRAPAAGTVVAAANDQPDYEIGRTRLDERTVLQSPMLLYGNYVVIDHGNGEFSMLAHMRQGSVTPKPGTRVHAGETIGRVGFSGAVYTIHLHYELRRGAGIDADGLPSYFRGVRRAGDRASRTPVRIDSGDIVESR